MSSKAYFETMVIKISEMSHFMYFLLIATKISPSLGKVFTSIWKVLFTSLRKFYWLLSYELQLARCQWLKLKLQDLSILLLTQLFINISATNILMVSSKPNNHIIFWKNSKRSARCTQNVLPKLWQFFFFFCCYQ